MISKVKMDEGKTKLGFIHLFIPKKNEGNEERTGQESW